MKTKYFINCKSLDEIKKLYKKLALENHPDRGGNTAIMQEINAEYQYIIKHKMYDFAAYSQEDQEEFLRYPDILNKIIGLQGITIEIIGNWIWVSGNTYQHKLILKNAQFFFAPKKVMWYYRPEFFKSSNKKPMDIEDIRNKYGSKIVNTEKSNINELEAA